MDWIGKKTRNQQKLEKVQSIQHGSINFSNWCCWFCWKEKICWWAVQHSFPILILSFSIIILPIFIPFCGIIIQLLLSFGNYTYIYTELMFNFEPINENVYVEKKPFFSAEYRLLIDIWAIQWCDTFSFFSVHFEIFSLIYAIFGVLLILMCFYLFILLFLFLIKLAFTIFFPRNLCNIPQTIYLSSLHQMIFENTGRKNERESCLPINLSLSGCNLEECSWKEKKLGPKMPANKLRCIFHCSILVQFTRLKLFWLSRLTAAHF